MAENYRDFNHERPSPGSDLPAFIVSEYEEGDVLLYSHGGFDIWCVYHAVRLDDTDFQADEKQDLYPLELDKLKVDKMTGGVTDFTGSFYEYALIDFEFDAPEDVDYLQAMRDLGEKNGKDRAWKTFCELYESIPQKRGVEITKSMTDTVIRLAKEYPEEKDLRFTLDCLLCAMIAENNRLRKYGSKFDTKVGKKIKALGVYQAIYETDLSIREVADYSKGMTWRKISDECAQRGITSPNL